MARLLPTAIEVKEGDDTIVVAGSPEENRILNYYLAAKIRAILDKAIQRYKDGEVLLTPRELRDLAGAGRDLSEFSATLYKESEPLNAAKPVEQITDVPNFDKLKPVELNDHKASSNGTGGPEKEGGRIGADTNRAREDLSAIPATDQSVAS